MNSVSEVLPPSKIGNYEVFGPYVPYKHQLAIVAFMLAYKRAYIWADMGTGKSACSLWFSDILLTAQKIKKVLIIAPLSTLDVVWVADLKKLCPYRSYTIVHGSREQRIKALNKDVNFYITNTDCPRTYLDELIALKPDVIIVDEITNFANPSSDRSKAMQKLAKTVRAIYGLSGNPTSGGLMNSYGIAKVIRPQGLPTPYITRYRDMLLQQVTLYEYIEKPGALELVNKVLSPAIKFSLEECIDLPPITFQTRRVELPAPTMKLYKEMVDHQIAEYKSGVITAATAGVKAIRLVQILTGFTKTEEGNIIRTDISPKLTALLDIYYEASNKLVVFVQSIETVHVLQEFFNSKKIHCRHIYGETPAKQRADIINEFQTRNDGVLVAQVKTMSHGITLTKSHTIVFFGVISGNEIYRQAMRRIRRIGQTHKQTIIKLVSTRFEENCFDRLDKEELTSQELLKMYEHGTKEFL